MITTSEISPGKWLESKSPEDTVRLGEWVGRRVRKGAVLSLTGNLGSGKTTFVKGLAKGLGIRVDPTEVVSPTFVLIKEYPCRFPLYHVDLYGLDEMGPADRLLIDDCLEGDGVAVFEWGERAGALLPPARLEIEFRYGEGDVRSVRLNPAGGFELSALER